MSCRTWHSFIKEQGQLQTEVYSFVAALSASNITKQAIFHAGETATDYSDLHVYLDSPIIFALLGMDDTSRTESYKQLVADMLKARCSVHVLDHNFQEVDSIIARAAGWATNTLYDLRKANNAARFFHDSQMDETEISEFCDNIEAKLILKTQFSNISWRSAYGIAGAVIATAIAGVIFTVGKKCCFKKVRSKLEKRMKQ